MWAYLTPMMWAYSCALPQLLGLSAKREGRNHDVGLPNADDVGLPNADDVGLPNTDDVDLLMRPPLVFRPERDARRQGHNVPEYSPREYSGTL